MANQYSIELTPEKAALLQSVLATMPGMEEGKREYTSFCYEKPGLSIAFYPKKGKLLIQGKGTDEFVEFVLEPKVTGVLLIPQTQEEKGLKSTRVSIHPGLDESPHFGVDESGKGDYFGPLVVAGVYTNGESARALAALGCCDSKAIKSEQKMNELASRIVQVPGIAYEVVCIGPKRYNELYADFGNLNRLLAWAHARVIASLHEKVPSCPRALSDQFANEWVLKRALGQRKIPVELEQRTKGESDIAVAAASILARARFVRWMREAAASAGEKIPLGCAPHVVKAAQNFVKKFGAERLEDVAKLHFKVTAQALKP